MSATANAAIGVGLPVEWGCSHLGLIPEITDAVPPPSHADGGRAE